MDDVFTVLTADHERILALSARLTSGAASASAGPKERKAIADELVMELSKHEVVEEMLLWPAVRDRADDGQELCATALEQEATGKRLLNELVKTSRPHPHVPARLELLKKVAPAAAVLDMARNALVRHR